MMFAEFWSARVGPYLAEHPAVVVQAEVQPDPVEVSPLLVTHFERTVPEVKAAEAVVLDRLAELVDAPRVPLLGLSPWEACRELFGAAAVSGPDGGGPARLSGPPLADFGADSVPS